MVIGGLAAVLHGSPQLTLDLDIFPSRDAENLDRLAAALRDMEARIRDTEVPDGLRFACDGGFLAATEILNLVTRFGELDVSFLPSGTAGFPDLVSSAVAMTINGSPVHVAALEDVIRSKEAANRPKDHRMLPLLRELLEEVRRRRGS